ncbi:hypothetical protein [Leptospira interrogans]|uniref:hypothetical protein n=1 Tax=Leptospira interrogans TaxID=173 RepID=UPI0012B67A60|nr:hypothetical protein [Leptospira interrogans]MCH5431453.1 hypothetical protein [Leptospira interrogans serovar Canicola]
MKSNTKSFYHLTFSSCTTDFRTPLSTLRVGSARKKAFRAFHFIYNQAHSSLKPYQVL